MTRPLVEIDDLTIGYRSGAKFADVLKSVSLPIHQGESLGLVGESGCGKSTLAFALLGYLRPGSVVRSGEVRLEGEDLFSLTPKPLRQIRGGRVALVAQDASQSLTPTMRVGAQVLETLKLHTELGSGEARNRVVEILDQVNLPDPVAISRRFPHELSGGQKQRVAIAVALAADPEMLVLDEPTTGLDATTQARVLDLLEGIRGRTGAAMVYVSHDLGVISRACDRMAVMYAGEVAEMGAAGDIFARPSHPYPRGLIASIPRVSEPGLPPSLPGQPPVPGERPKGCAFVSRCPFADEKCETLAPTLQRISGKAQGEAGTPHFARCHYSERVASSPPPRATRPPSADKRWDSEEALLLEIQDLEAIYASPGVSAALRRLRGSTKETPVLSNIDLDIRRGETLALVGESGSGKSTLARIVAGLQSPSGGRLRFGGEPLSPHVERRSPQTRRKIQLIFQDPDSSLNPRHTVRDILERPLRLFFGLSRKQRGECVSRLLKQVRLSARHAERYPGQLSGGEKQRVAIARAFAAEPDLIICDEVVSALDVSVQAAVLELLAELQAERSVAYLFITHDLAVVRAVADRVAVLNEGRLCETGPTEEIYAPPRHPYTESLLSAALEPASPRGNWT